MVEEADWLAVILHCFSFLTLKTSFRSRFPPTDLGFTMVLHSWRQRCWVLLLLEVQKGHLGSTWVQQMSVFQGSFGVDVQIASLCSYSEDLPFGEPEIR